MHPPSNPKSTIIGLIIIGVFFLAIIIYDYTSLRFQRTIKVKKTKKRRRRR